MTWRPVGLMAAVAASCSSPPGALTGSTGDASPVDAWIGPTGCESGLAFADISDRSPDLGAHPYGGEPGWDHADKYGPGIALGDLDGDGHLDLVQVRSERSHAELRPPVIYRGLGDGSFEEAATPTWRAQDNATFALLLDHDADGDLDLLIGVAGADVVLYRNDGGFELSPATREAGLMGLAAWSFTASAGDVDGDGDLDLYLGQWRGDLVDHGLGLAPNLLLLNEGGRFAPADEDLGCGGRATLGTAMADLDGDHDLDIYVANDFFADCLYENRGAAGWLEIGVEAGIADGAMHAMGVALGDLNGDAELDILVTDTEQPDGSRGSAVYLRDPADLHYTSAALQLGLDGVSTLQADWLVSWGAAIEDFDLDGFADVHMATHTERKELFWHNQDGSFVPSWPVINSLDDVDARGSAYGDIDEDGDLDIVVGRRNDSVQVLRNERSAGATALRVQIEPFARAIGATLRIQSEGREQVRVIQAGSGYMSTSPAVATFGLCGASAVDRLEIQFADGSSHVALDVPAGLYLLPGGR